MATTFTSSEKLLVMVAVWLATALVLTVIFALIYRKITKKWQSNSNSSAPPNKQISAPTSLKRDAASTKSNPKVTRFNDPVSDRALAEAAMLDPDFAFSSEQQADVWRALAARQGAQNGAQNGATPKSPGAASVSKPRTGERTASKRDSNVGYIDVTQVNRPARDGGYMESRDPLLPPGSLPRTGTLPKDSSLPKKNSLPKSGSMPKTASMPSQRGASVKYGFDDSASSESSSSEEEQAPAPVPVPSPKKAPSVKAAPTPKPAPVVQPPKPPSPVFEAPPTPEPPRPSQIQAQAAKSPTAVAPPRKLSAAPAPRRVVQDEGDDFAAARIRRPNKVVPEAPGDQPPAVLKKTYECSFLGNCTCPNCMPELHE